MLLCEVPTSLRSTSSGFDAPELLSALRHRKTRRLWIGGLATEYCVKATALDGRKNDFEVFIIEDAIRGIDVQEGDCDRTRREMEAAGIGFYSSEAVGMDNAKTRRYLS